MSKMSTNCKLYFICHKMSNVKKSNTLTMDEVHKKFNLTQWGSHTNRSILRRNMKMIENAPKHILWSFWRFSVTIICDIKFNLRVCEPHCVKLKFLWTSFIANIFDFLTSVIFSHIHPLPHAPTPATWPHTLPHVPSLCHMSPPLPLLNTHRPCHMIQPPATRPHPYPKPNVKTWKYLPGG